MGAIVLGVTGLMAAIAVLWFIFAGALWGLEILVDLRAGRKPLLGIILIIVFLPWSLLLLPFFWRKHQDDDPDASAFPI